MPKVENFNKEEIIIKALEVFHSKGYNLASMQDLVDATGLNRSSIYNSFGSKLELYKLCLAAYKRNSRIAVNDCLEKSNCVLENIKAIFSLAISENEEELKKGCLFNSCASEMANQEASVKPILLNNNLQMQELFTSLVQKGQDNGLFNTKRTAGEYGLYLLSSFQGIRISGIILNDKKDLETIIQTAVSILE
ncbi:TetR/AcrR family transcriptional regulator [Polaribacter sp. P097]|uniref:TetR/AcrR family transcriptional regulator n=1 Tax=Polaribacter sp. P097 TaxID=3117398 RepID=UPI002FE03FD8